MIPGGRNVPVTDENKAEYIRLVAHHRMTSSIRSQVRVYIYQYLRQSGVNRCVGKKMKRNPNTLIYPNQILIQCSLFFVLSLYFAFLASFCPFFLPLHIPFLLPSLTHFLHSFVSAYISLPLQIEAFLDGFYEQVPPELISVFSPTELELVICGLPDVDVDDLHANTEYHQYR